MTPATPPAVPFRGLPGWIVRVRAPFFTAVLVPTALGTAMCWTRLDFFSPFRLLLILIAGVLTQAGANLINDYFDYLNGTDRLNKEAIAPYTGGGPQVRLGLITPARARNEALVYFGIALALGVYLALTGSPWLLVIGALGLGMALLYTAPGIFLVGAGLGEVAIFLCFGPLFVMGVWMALTGTFSWEAVWASFPAGFLITNVIWINQFPDMPADAAVGKRHWVVRLGRKRSAYIYGGLFLATYLSLVLGMLVGGLPVWTGLGLLTIPMAWKAWQISMASYDRMQELGAANALTIQIHLLTGILMTLGYLAARIFS